MNSLQDVDTKIQKNAKAVRLRGLLKKRQEGLSEFLVKFFTKWNVEKPTIYLVEKSIQTDPGKRRSIGDIYLICKYYYPTCTIDEVADIVYNELFQDVPRFRSCICSQIKKRVFYVGSANQPSQIHNAETKDEFGLTVGDWKAIL